MPPPTTLRFNFQRLSWEGGEPQRTASRAAPTDQPFCQPGTDESQARCSNDTLQKGSIKQLECMEPVTCGEETNVFSCLQAKHTCTTHTQVVKRAPRISHLPSKWSGGGSAISTERWAGLWWHPMGAGGRPQHLRAPLICSAALLPGGGTAHKLCLSRALYLLSICIHCIASDPHPVGGPLCIDGDR